MHLSALFCSSVIYTFPHSSDFIVSLFEIRIKESIESQNYIHFIRTCLNSLFALQEFHLQKGLGSREASGYHGDMEIFSAHLVHHRSKVGIDADGCRQRPIRIILRKGVHFFYESAHGTWSVVRFQRGQVEH